MAIEIIPIDEQPRANGFMWGGKTVGIAAATAGGAWMINAYGLRAAWLGHALLVGIVMLIPLLARERPGERLAPWTAGRAAEEAQRLQLGGWRDIGSSLLQVFLLPGSLVLALVGCIYMLGTGLIGAMLPVLTVQQLGWTNVEYSDLSAGAGLVAGLIGMLAGGLLAERLGPWRAVAFSSLLLAAAATAMGLLPMMWHLRLSVQAYVFAVLLLDTLISIAFFAAVMRICWKRVAATQFSLYMAIANIGLSGGSALLGPMRQWFEYSTIFFALACCALAVVVLTRLVDANRLSEEVRALG